MAFLFGSKEKSFFRNGKEKLIQKTGKSFSPDLRAQTIEQKVIHYWGFSRSIQKGFSILPMMMTEHTSIVTSPTRECHDTKSGSVRDF